MERAPSEDATDARALSRPRILHVEDDEDTQILLRTLLEGRFALDTASTAEEALAVISEAAPYDLVLLDINLGAGKSGADLIRELRERADYAAVPVVALTAYALPGDREKFEGMGFTAYLAKPFRVEDLIDLVDGLLRR